MQATGKKWKKGDKGWICYRYTAAGCRPVPVTVERNQDRRGYVEVALPGLFGGEIVILCHALSVTETQQEAEAIAAEDKDYEPTPQ